MWTTSIVRNAQTYITNSRSKRTKTLNFQFLSQRSWTWQHTDPPQVTLKFSQSFLFSHIVSVFNCLPPFLTAVLRSIAFFPACFMLEKKPIIMLTYPCPHPHTPPLVQCLIITIDTLYWAPRTRKNIFVIGHRHEAEMGSISFLREQGGNVWLQKSSKMTSSPYLAMQLILPAFERKPQQAFTKAWFRNLSNCLNSGEISSEKGKQHMLPNKIKRFKQLEISVSECLPTLSMKKKSPHMQNAKTARKMGDKTENVGGLSLRNFS